MITWWDWPTYIIIVFHVSPFNHSFVTSGSCPAHNNPHPLERTTLVITRIHFILFSILVISSLTNPGYRDQDPIILIFLIHDFCECVTGILSLVTTDYIIHDSSILDILSPSIHELPEFSLCDTLHLPQEIFLRVVLCHDVYRVIFNSNIPNINTLILHHDSQKIMTNIDFFLYECQLACSSLGKLHLDYPYI